MTKEWNAALAGMELDNLNICTIRTLAMDMVQAEKSGHTLQREIGFLTVHSLLHLLGYDHENGGLEAVQMREKEEGVLNKLNID